MQEPQGAPAGEPSLGTMVSRGLGWSLGGQVITRVLVFGSGIALARLLDQETFGTFATALLLVNVLMAFNELGIIPALINWRGDMREAAGTGLTMALGFSAALYGLVFIAAGRFATVAGTPEAANVVRVLALMLIIDGLVSPYWSVLSREFLQARQTLAEAVGMVAFAATSIGLAAAGYGAMGMAWGRVAGNLVTALMFVALSPYRFRPQWKPHVARQLLRFGWGIAAGALMMEAVLNVDYFVVGRELGTAALGAYLLAFNLSSWPVSTVSLAIGRVSFAGFARLAHDPFRLRTGFTRSFGIAASATAPVVVGVAVLAPELVRFLYGDRWADAITPLRFLIVLGGLRVLLELLGEVVAVTGRPPAVFRARALWLVALVPLLLVGARADGLRGVGIGHVAAVVAVVTPLLLWEARRSGIPAGGLGRMVVRPAIGGAAMTAAMVLVAGALSGDVVTILGAGVVGVVVYTAVVVPGNELLRWMWLQFRGGGGPEPAPAPAPAERH